MSAKDQREVLKDVANKVADRSVFLSENDAKKRLSAKKITMKKVTTKSGAVYLIDEERSFWKKNNDPWERTYWAHGVYPEDFIRWHNKEPYDHQPIAPGVHLYIGCRGSWWLSTPIISVEEIEHVESV